ncbi:MAG: NfeD family protein [Gammaproteobacteria bacterium]
MDWWHWIVLGSLLLAAEIFAIEAQFYLVFVGLSAVVVGVLGLTPIDLPVWAQWTTFGLLSVISMFSLRKVLHEKVHGNTPGYRVGLAGEVLTIETAIDAGKSSRVSFRGTDWTVVNEGATSIGSGERVQIKRSEGLTLYVGATA